MAKKWASNEIISAEKFNELGVKTFTNIAVPEDDLPGVKFRFGTFRVKNGNQDRRLWDFEFGTIRMFVNQTSPTLKEHENTWLLCDGREVDIGMYNGLYNILGNLYGTSSSSSTFKLPDLRDKYIRCANDDTDIANETGENAHMLTIDEMPSHNHNVNLGTTNYSGGFSGNPSYNIRSGSTGFSGGNNSHENRPKSLCVNFYICGRIP